MPNNYAQAINIMKNAKTIAVYMHVNPDGDCVGSSLAVYKFLTKLGKIVHCFSAGTLGNEVPEKLKFLPGVEIYNKNCFDKYDLSIGVDIADAGRLGDSLFKQFMKSDNSLVIDHHEGNSDFATINIRERSAASTTQLLYKILKEYDENNLDIDIATCLYAGLVTDSGCFSFSCTSSETHIVAAELFKYGIDYNNLNYRLMRDISYNVFNLKMKVVSAAKFYDDNKIGIIVFRENDFAATNTVEANTDGIINALLDISDVEIGISIAEIGDKKFKVSFRTKEKVSAASCANCFGGGGHNRAAGCRVYGYFDDIYEKILSVAREMLSYA